MRVLFVCNQNKHRSKTAEDVFKNRFETKSAGLYSGNVLSEKELLWADVVAVMEEEQRSEIAKRFPKLYLQKQIVCLDIPDLFHRDQPELVSLLHDKIVGVFESL